MSRAPTWHVTVKKEPSSRPRIGRFVLTRKLGKGGQGSVYLAQDETLDRQVAIKVIHEDSIGGSARAGELPSEARMAARWASVASGLASIDTGSPTM